MASGRPQNTLALRQWKDAATSPERTIVWTEPKPKPKPNRVCVVYYLSRNGLLDHPHFMELPLSSPDGLYLKDVINRLDFLRGKGLANSYSWSVKRRYKNGFVWHDLSDNDLIVPTHGQDYVLKGSERIYSPFSDDSPPEFTPKPSAHDRRHRRTTPWGSFDLNEYKVYKTDHVADAAINAATQTNDRRLDAPKVEELESEEISPPPSSSSPEGMETLGKPDGCIAAGAESFDRDRVIGSGGRMRASNVLMQLISCGSIGVKDLSARSPFHRFSGRLSTRGGAFDGSMSMNSSGFSGMVGLEDKEYFSGSVIETNKNKGVIRDDDGVNDDGFARFKRSSSYNAELISKLDVVDKGDKVGAKCIPRKAKSLARKECNAAISRTSLGTSKRISEEAHQIV